MTDKLWTIWNRPGKDPDYATNQAKRGAWFTKIAPKGNWKEPIDTWIAEADFENCNQAAIYFCGCPLQEVEKKDGHIHVTAAGYYATIGS